MGMALPMRNSEIALEPKLDIVDSHHHLWNDTKAHVTAVPYRMGDLARDVSSGHNVVATVYVECSSNYRRRGPASLAPVGETEWVVNQDAPRNVLNGIVGFADMLLGNDVAGVLAAHAEIAGGRFKGVRHSVARDDSPQVLTSSRNPPHRVVLDPVFQNGVRAVGRAGLVFETWAYFHQLKDIARLANSSRDVQIVVNHMGGPVVVGPYSGKRAAVLEEWRDGLHALAQAENVVLKLGGIGFEAFVEDSVSSGARDSERLAEYWRPEMEFCIETFSPSRCMFESNFPVDSSLCDYVTMWNVFKRITFGLAVDERAALFSKTAMRVYSL